MSWLREDLFAAPRKHLDRITPMAMQISTPRSLTGRLMLLEQPYDLHAETLSKVATTSKRRTVDNPHVEGTYTLSAHRENQKVPVFVWVEARTQAELDAAQRALTEAFDQMSFEIEWQLDDIVETWRCTGADYEIDTQQAFMHSKMSLVSAQVDRLPTIDVRRLR